MTTDRKQHSASPLRAYLKDSYIFRIPEEGKNDAEIYLKYRDNILRSLNSKNNLYGLLNNLTTDQRSDFYAALKANPEKFSELQKDFFKEYHPMTYAPAHPSETVKDEVQDLFMRGKELIKKLKGAKDEKTRSAIYEQYEERIPELIKSPEEFKKLIDCFGGGYWQANNDYQNKKKNYMARPSTDRNHSNKRIEMLVEEQDKVDGLYKSYSAWRDKIYDTFKDDWSKLRVTQENFHYILYPLSPDQRAEVFKVFMTDNRTIVKSAIRHFGIDRAHFCSIAEKDHARYRKIFALTDSDNINMHYASLLSDLNLLDKLSPDDLQAFYQMVLWEEQPTDQLNFFRISAEGFGMALKFLTPAQRTQAYRTIPEDHFSRIGSAQFLFEVLYYLKPEERTKVVSKVDFTKIMFCNHYMDDTTADTLLNITDLLDSKTQKADVEKSFCKYFMAGVEGQRIGSIGRLFYQPLYKGARNHGADIHHPLKDERSAQICRVFQEHEPEFFEAQWKTFKDENPERHASISTELAKLSAKPDAKGVKEAKDAKGTQKPSGAGGPRSHFAPPVALPDSEATSAVSASSSSASGALAPIPPA